MQKRHGKNGNPTRQHRGDPKQVLDSHWSAVATKSSYICELCHKVQSECVKNTTGAEMEDGKAE